MGKVLHVIGAATGTQGQILQILVIFFLIAIAGVVFISILTKPKSQARIRIQDDKNQARSCQKSAQEEARWKEKR